MNNEQFIVKKINSGWFIFDLQTNEMSSIDINPESQVLPFGINKIYCFYNNILSSYELTENKLELINKLDNIKSFLICDNEYLIYNTLKNPELYQVFDISYNLIDQYVLPTNSNVLDYKKEKFIVYNNNNRIYIKNKLKTICLNINSEYIKLGNNGDIIIYINNHFINYLSLNNMKIFKKIHCSYETKINSMVISEKQIIVSEENKTFLITDKIDKIIKNISHMYPFKNTLYIQNNQIIDEDISIVLTCHTEYLKYLLDCVNSINKQKIQPKQKILVLDNVDVFNDKIYNLNGWQIIQGDWGNPNVARNIGLKQCKTEWVIFFDADNIMMDDYISSLSEYKNKVDNNIAFIYKDILLKYGEKTIKHSLVQNWDYWNLREGNFIDTSSLWRVQAIDNINGWNENIENEDDYNLVLRLSGQGWNGEYLSSQPGALHISHQKEGRWFKNYDKIMESLFNSYSFSIISLLSGRKTVYNKWVEAIMNTKKPTYLNLVLLDDSHDEKFHNNLKNLYKLDGFQNINIIKSPFVPQQISTLIDKHKRVAKLYNHVLTNINTDFILTIEDDVIIPINTIEYLFSVFKPKHMTLNKNVLYYGAVGGLYQSPSNSELAVAALDNDKWENMPKYKDSFYKIVDVGFIGGGCSMWFNGALKQALPMQPKIINNKLYGWDSDVCNKIKKAGYSICLNGNVICNHLFKE